MNYKRKNTDCLKLITIKHFEPKEEKNEENNGFKKIIDTLSRKMNASFPGSGIMKEGFYYDKPHFGYKLYKKDGKIYQYVHLPREKKETLEPFQPLVRSALKMDIGDYRLEQENLELSSENLYTFAVKGLSQQYAIQLDREFHQQIQSLFQSVGQDELMYSLVIKEVENHNNKRLELSKRFAGIDPDDKKAMILHNVKRFTLSGAKVLYDFWTEEEKKEKHREYKENFQARMNQLFPKRLVDNHPLSKRKLAENNQYMQVEVLFLLWTADKEKAQQFKSELQQLMTSIQGENQLQVVEIKPDLKRVQKGQLHYDGVPQLCLYQREFSKFLYLPSSEDIDDDFYYERPTKTEIPKEMFQGGRGAVPFAKDINSNKIIYQPKPRSRQEIDDWVKATLIVSEQGAGKTTILVNQALETFGAHAKDYKEWLKIARSVIHIDVADGKTIDDIRQHIPEWLQHRVIILNHADIQNPIAVGSHDILKLSKNKTATAARIAQAETKMLIDCLEEDTKTISVERYFKFALQASYVVGKGNILEAVRILMEEKCRAEILKKLEEVDPYLYGELFDIDQEFEDEKNAGVMKTIRNRISHYTSDSTLIELLAQEPNEDIDFWKWMNGDEDGPYMVLIYLPDEEDSITKQCRNYLFAHYFLKIWRLMKTRGQMPEEKRPMTLVQVDELHLILKQRPIIEIFPDLFKEPRKYRVRYNFTFHDWSSIEKAGKSKEAIVTTMKGAGCNLFLMKGGEDFFKSLSGMLTPYNLDDFNGLLELPYCAIFRVAFQKKAQVFQARLLEPADMRLPTYKVKSFKGQSNELGRSGEIVKQKIVKELKEMAHSILQQKLEREKAKEKDASTAKKVKKVKETALNL